MRIESILQIPDDTHVDLVLSNIGDPGFVGNVAEAETCRVADIMRASFSAIPTHHYLAAILVPVDVAASFNHESLTTFDPVVRSDVVFSEGLIGYTLGFPVLCPGLVRDTHVEAVPQGTAYALHAEEGNNRVHVSPVRLPKIDWDAPYYRWPVRTKVSVPEDLMAMALRYAVSKN